MEIISFASKDIERLRFRNAAKGGGVESAVLPIRLVKVAALPNDLQALLITSDLQGVLPLWQSASMQLLGEGLVAAYQELAAKAKVPSLAATGVILAGDFYAAPAGDKRGASGDVSRVWHAFADAFRWVVGVQGNHDTFEDWQGLQARANLHILA